MKAMREGIRKWVACVALFAATCASAQGLAWNTLALGTAYGNMGCNISHIGADAGAAACVTLTFPTAVPTQGEVVCMEGAMARGVGGIVLTAGAGGSLTATLREASGSFVLAGQGATLRLGKNEVAFAVDRGSAAAGYPVRIAVFVNGAEAFSHVGSMSGITFGKITVGRGYDGAADAPWDVSDATISGRFARADTVVDACRGELTRGGVLTWSALLSNDSGIAPQPAWSGLFAISGKLTSGKLEEWVTAASLADVAGADYTLAPALAPRLLAKVPLKAGAAYAELASGSLSPLRFEDTLAAMGEEAVTFVFFNKYWKSAYVRTITGISDAKAGVPYSLGGWVWPSGTNGKTTFAGELSLARENLALNFSSTPLGDAVLAGLDALPGAMWLTVGATANLSAYLGGRNVRVSATGALEGDGATPLLGEWLADADAGPSVRVDNLPEGLYTVVVYCGGAPADTVGFRAVLVGSDRRPETPFADLGGAAITAAPEDGFGKPVAGLRLGANVLRVNNVPVGEGGHLILHGQPDEPVWAMMARPPSWGGGAGLWRRCRSSAATG